MQRTLVIIKPDAMNRGLAGEITARFEDKGLKIVGMKMKVLEDEELAEHYSHLKDKPFFPALRDFMKHSPSLIVCLEGNGVVDAVRLMCGPTHGLQAAPGTIRGDYSMSIQQNIVHASEDLAAAEAEVKRFFKEDELFSYQRMDMEMVYSIEER
jgi:nucleoside-diphosphate kinase